MFLMTFGYLPQSDLETGNLRTEHQVRDAIKTMQVIQQRTARGIVDPVWSNNNQQAFSLSFDWTKENSSFKGT